MEIIVASTAGFCAGVRRAVEIAKTEARNASTKECNGCVTIGPLIHNEDMINDLERFGVHVVEEFSEFAGRTVIIPSHGTTRENLERIRSSGSALVDATCFHVVKLRQKAVDWERSGGKVIIVGEAQHTEIRGVASHLESPIIIGGPDEIPEGLGANDDYLLLSQTTALKEDVLRVFGKLLGRGLKVRLEDTICPATSERQREAAEVSGKTDAIIVLGSIRSANTNRLEAIARSSGKPVYRASNVRGLDIDDIKEKQFGKIGIIAGASTPDSIIKEVVKAMIETGEEKELTMAELEKLYPEKNEEVKEAPKKRDLQIVKGTVTLVTEDEVLADVGQGSDVHIPKNQLTFSKSVSPLKLFKTGDEITVALEDFDSTKDIQYASKVKADALTAWNVATASFESGTPVEGTIVEAVKGGVVVDAGIRGFLPASQIGSRVEDLSTLIGSKVKAKIIELEEDRKSAVLSVRALSEATEAKQKTENLASIEVGSTYDGTVRKLTSFGAFVSLLPGVDGLVHVSEIAWQRVASPADVLTEGMQVKVKVLSVDKASGKVSLSMKQLIEKPRYKTVGELPTEGEVYKGVVSKLMSFGAFVKMDGGHEGLVHVSQISDKRLTSPDEVLSLAQEVKVKVLSVDRESGKISLSIRDAELKEQRDEYEGYMKSAESDFQITIADRIRIKGERKK